MTSGYIVGIDDLIKVDLDLNLYIEKSYRFCNSLLLANSSAILYESSYSTGLLNFCIVFFSKWN